MTTAKTIAAKVAGASAVTLRGGYAVFANGERVTFETAHVEKEKRNKSGRCVELIASYADGSRLRFTWSEASGPRYAVLA
jgi:hypothetical protein